MKNDRLLCVWIFLFFASLYSLFSIGHYGGDGYEDYLTAKSIVLSHSLAYNDGSYSKNQSGIDELNYRKEAGVMGVDGKTYNSRGGLVMPAILSIFFYLGHIIALFFKDIPHDFITMFFVSFANPVISAFNCLLIFVIAVRLSFSDKLSFVLSAIYGLATMAPVYARTGFAEPSLSLFMLLYVYFVLKYTDARNVLYLILAAFAASCAVSVRSFSIIFIPLFALYPAWLIFAEKSGRTRHMKDFGLFTISLFVFLVVLVGFYNHIIYGSFLKFGNKEALGIVHGALERLHLMKGAYYYLFSTGKGFFIFNLPLILAAFGLLAVKKERRKATILFAAIFILDLLFFSMRFKRGSLFAWGPRYLFPSVTFLIFLVGNFYEKKHDLIGKLSMWILSVAGFFLMVPCMFINQSKFYFFIKEKLHLPEYLINFVPDLSPIRGAWEMFVSYIAFAVKGIDMPFLYNPDYKLVTPSSASMLGYNNFDFWFLKIFALKPEFSLYVYAIMVFLGAIALISIVSVIKSLKGKAG